MYKILIVDDFFVDRESMKVIIESFINENLEIVGECEDGIQALELIAVLEPDIVICDVEMPGMDGFELAKNIKYDFPNVKIIFCSLYDEFEYARKALYLDSYGYVLKPVDADELKHCILKVTGRLASEAEQLKEHDRLQLLFRESRPLLVDNLIKGLLFGLGLDSNGIWDRIEYLKLGIKKGSFVLSLIEIDDYEKVTAGKSFEQKQLFSFKVFERVREICSAFVSALLTRVDDSHLAILFSLGDLMGAQECLEYVSSVCSRIMREFSKSDISLSITVSQHCQDIFTIKDLLEQCLYLMKHKYTLGKGKIICNSDIPSVTTSPGIDFNSIQQKIRFLINVGTAEQIRQYIEDLFQNVPSNAGEQYLKNLCFCITISVQIILGDNNETFNDVFDDKNLVWEKLLKFETILDAGNWVKNLCLFVNEHLARKADHKNNAIVEEVHRYVEANYLKNIRLETIATDLFYSPNYINYVFKTATGETIFDYVIRYRVEKAKEMLCNPKAKLYEIAEVLGYSHTSYFSNVFKKYAGVTPKEYRERIGL